MQDVTTRASVLTLALSLDNSDLQWVVDKLNNILDSNALAGDGCGRHVDKESRREAIVRVLQAEEVHGMKNDGISDNEQTEDMSSDEKRPGGSRIELTNLHEERTKNKKSGLKLESDAHDSDRHPHDNSKSLQKHLMRWAIKEQFLHEKVGEMAEAYYHTLLFFTLVLSALITFINAAADPLQLTEGTLRIIAAGISAINGIFQGVMCIYKFQSRADAHGHTAAYLYKFVQSLWITGELLKGAKLDAQAHLVRMEDFQKRAAEAQNMCPFNIPWRVRERFKKEAAKAVEEAYEIDD